MSATEKSLHTKDVERVKAFLQFHYHLIHSQNNAALEIPEFDTAIQTTTLTAGFLRWNIFQDCSSI